MSAQEQCPSTRGKKPARKQRERHAGVGVNGRAYWRSLDDLADTAEFRDWLEREFPEGASRLLGSSRRNFLKLMGASLALAGAAAIPGCRRPDHKIMPYGRSMPEDTIPGKALYFATSMPLPGGGAEGLVVETHENRPTKAEGNPLHPVNRGKSSAWSQAAVLGLYDPDRVKDPVFTKVDSLPRSLDDFRAWSPTHFERFDAVRGAGLAFLVEKKSSPSREHMRRRIRERWPEAAWIAYDPLHADAPVEGTAAAFGAPMREQLHLDKARVILSLDRDFLHQDPASLVHNRDFAASRRVTTTSDTMSRLYAVESGYTLTGARADHRLRLAPSRIPAFAAALARRLLGGLDASGAQQVRAALGALGEPGDADQAGWLDAVAENLLEHRGESLIVAGPSQPAAVHALVHAVNHLLGNTGATVSFLPMEEEDAASPHGAMGALCRRIDAGEIDTLVCIGVNPVYDAPPGLGFASRFERIETRIVASMDTNETIAAGHWQIPLSHFLESWGDTRAWDGTVAPIQPMIAPLYASLSDLEILAVIVGDETADGHEIVRRAWREGLVSNDFEKTWRRALFDGVLAGSVPRSRRLGVNYGRVASLCAGLADEDAPGEGSLDVVFIAGQVGDGRYANCGWLQELPQPITRLVWDNAALVSPATAAALGLEPEPATRKKARSRVATLTVGERSMDLPVFPVPGMPDNTVVLPVGYGREVCGLVAEGVGFNTYRLRGDDGSLTARGATLEGVRGRAGWHHLVTTQMHGSMEGRAILREVDLPAWQLHGDEVITDKDGYGAEKSLNFAERLGELAHTPANRALYVNPFNESLDDAAPGSRYDTPPQWGMSIDLGTCIGCNVCTIACQAENNIPIVGKAEVDKGREMHWIRVDRYFAGDEDNPVVSHQPVACIHCENAPCETVCPVNATVHGPSGLNYMVYNRCIGTRYCANNCPYKVRRFNFFDYGVAKFRGDYIGREAMPGGGPENRHLIPPRLREKLDEITKMHMNPNVTVRSRGVMEKCTYCIQRINEARVRVKLQNLEALPDGFFQTACQQACPADAISFGDILDERSRVRGERDNNRSYLLLGYLNTRPRTTYMVALRNPNPRLVEAERREHWRHPFHADAGGAGRGVIPVDEHHDKGRVMSLTVLGGRA